MSLDVDVSHPAKAGHGHEQGQLKQSTGVLRLRTKHGVDTIVYKLDHVTPEQAEDCFR